METQLLSTDRPIAIYYAFSSEINSYSQTGNSECSVTLSSEWKKIHTSIGKINIIERQVQTDAGVKYVTELSAQCPGHDENTPGDISEVEGRKVLLRCDYRNGMKKIIGSKVSGPKLFMNINSSNITNRTLQLTFENTGPNLWLV